MKGYLPHQRYTSGPVDWQHDRLWWHSHRDRAGAKQRANIERRRMIADQAEDAVSIGFDLQKNFWDMAARIMWFWEMHRQFRDALWDYCNWMHWSRRETFAATIGREWRAYKAKMERFTSLHNACPDGERSPEEEALVQKLERHYEQRLGSTQSVA